MKYLSLTSALLVLALTACSTNGTLRPVDRNANISGVVMRGAIEPHLVEVNFEGKVYRGEWRTGQPTAEQTKAAGLPHRHHVGQVHTRLVADDGSVLTCKLATHSEKGEGICNAGGREIAMTLQ